MSTFLPPANGYNGRSYLILSYRSQLAALGIEAEVESQNLTTFDWDWYNLLLESLIFVWMVTASREVIMFSTLSSVTDPLKDAVGWGLPDAANAKTNWVRKWRISHGDVYGNPKKIEKLEIWNFNEF